MTAQKASPAARLAGWAAVMTAALLTGAVILHLAGRRERPARSEDARAPAASGPVDRKEKVRHREFLEGRTSAEIMADRYFLGPDGLRHLEGAVEVAEYGPDGAVVSRISADEILYDEDRSFFRISGRARISVENVVLEGPRFEYDQAGGAFRTGQGGAFLSERMSGEAAGISYARESEEVLLSGGFRIAIGARDPGAGGPVLTGESLRFLRVPGRGEAGGRVRFAHGRIEGAAEAMTFALDDEGRSFRSMDLDGEPSITLDGPAGDGAAGLTLRSDTISASFSSDDGRIETLEARGGARLSLFSPAEWRVLLTAGRIQVRLEGSGEVRRWAASEGFRMEYAGEPERDWTLEGAAGEGDGGLRSLRAAAGAGREAALESARFRVAAAALELADEGREVRAEGGLEGLFRSRPDVPLGFFSSEAPILVSAERMERSGRTGQARFEGTARIRQGDRRIEAGDLSVDEGTGEVRARGRAAARFPHGPGRGADGEAVEAGGDALSYSPPDRLLSLRGKGFVRMRGAALAAEEIAGVLGESGRGLDTLTARTGVVVSRGRYEGRGGEARYDAAADRIEIGGNPVLVDGDGRVSRGSKLTFDLADDRIRLENEGQGRSTTVIKSRTMRGFLRAVDLKKRYGTKKAVDGVSIEVGEGEVVGLLGPNGAGKTTTFSMILGLVPQDGGRVYLRDEDITDWPMYRRARKGLVLLPQEPSAFRKLSVEANLLAVLETRPRGAASRRSRVAETLAEFGLEHLAGARAVTLSGGERRRLEIARAMITDPEFLLLDEPFTGIDPLSVRDLQTIIRKLRDKGLGILLTDHSVREALEATDRAYILDGGRILKEGAPGDIVASEDVRKSYLGDQFRL